MLTNCAFYDLARSRELFCTLPPFPRVSATTAHAPRTNYRAQNVGTHACHFMLCPVLLNATRLARFRTWLVKMTCMDNNSHILVKHPWVLGMNKSRYRVAI